MKVLFVSFSLALSIGLAGCGKKAPDYLNTALPFEERVDDLVSRMTLEEKISQLVHDAPAIERLHVPAHNWWNESLHGVARAGLATVFPQSIGMASMWDEEEMLRIATAISDEARAKYQDFSQRGKRGIYQGLSYWTPNINIFRDPRWGRGMETYGEDPYLTGELGVNFIKGMQGDDPKYLKIIATAKHFSVHSGPESTRHSADVYPSDYDLKETYLPHFERAVREAHVYSVMCAYQRLRGLPCCGSQYLNNLLRNEWGFEGYIVSDCGGIGDFYQEHRHHVTDSPQAAAAMAVQAGTDLNCGQTYAYLSKAVADSLITEAEIDVAVRRVMMARMKVGQFDPDAEVKYTQIPYSVVNSPENQQLALEATRKSLVLLKNAGNTLPFSKEVKKVAVIGPNANDVEMMIGNYNGFPSHPVTPLEGIRRKLPDAEVAFAQGCSLVKGLPYLEVIPADYLFTDATQAQAGLQAEYFNNPAWEGTPIHERIDARIDFDWWTTPPYEEMAYDAYSVRWKGVLVPPASGEYAIGADAFTGYKVYLDGQLIKDWDYGRSSQNQYFTMMRKQHERLTLEGGKAYDLVVEYKQQNSEYAMMRLLWEPPKPALLQEAVALAQSSDLVVMCMGLTPLLEGEALENLKVEGFYAGDRLDIQLPETQRELIREIQKTKKPIVLVLLNGSPLTINWEQEHIPAIIEAWYPGQAGGTAIADVIFGDYNPAGRLPVTVYKSVDQIPAFDNYDMEGRTYRYFNGQPLYEFGYGLSYTTFAYELTSIPQSLPIGESLDLTVQVTNTGQRDGDEVVQLYVSLPDSRLKKPIRSLQGFQRIHLKAGETKTVAFTLKPHQMAARGEDNTALVEAGSLLVSVGGKQPDAAALGAKQVVQQSVALQGETFVIDELND
jgi:beta-glucosidase